MSSIDLTARKVAQELLAIRAGEPAPELQPPVNKRSKIDYPRLQHQMRWFEGLLKLYRATAGAVSDQLTVDEPDDRREGDGELIAVLRRAHRLLLEHPVAAKAAYTALVAQGRAYAATHEGADLRARLAVSPRLRRGTLLWRSLTMGMLDEADRSELPSTYLDNLLRAVDRIDLEQLLGKLQQP